ncbi:site-specific integrase [Demequina sp. B12]|uniref:tyrosine-type recombinase/integrase n=1 Tax=Demequina sp. B12 TaxID=2992757 RepID=UPI00237B5AC7|nr:site-specific integrase [Demequina sp. B12]MDE0571816.1 site-specific integrase [Demequina sp. B12]
MEAWGPSRAAAERAIRDRLTTLVALTGTTITSETRLAELATFWLRTEVADSDRAANTKKRYADIVAKRIVPGIGGLAVREATVARMAAYIDGVAHESATTANLCRSVLVGMFNVAVRHDAKQSNPIREIAAIPTPVKEVRALSQADVTALRKDLASDKQALRADLPAVVDVMLATGCRVGEALALRWQDIDLDAKTVRITGTIVRDEKLGLVRQDKTKGRKPRALRLPSPLVARLMERSVDGLPGGPLDLVFPTANLTPREVSTVMKQWRDFRARHPRWDWVTTHVFRKSVATAIENADGVEAAAKVLGHSSPRTTAKHYVEAPELSHDAAETLAAFVAPLDENAG